MNFSKILSLSVILSASLFANDSTVVDFEKKRVAQNPNVKVKDVKVNTKKDLPLAGWNGYILDVEAIVQEKSLKVKDILFSNGDYIALDLIDAKTGKSLKDLVTPNLSDKYHDKSKLIAGNHNAKDKIVVFSDLHSNIYALKNLVEKLEKFSISYVMNPVQYKKQTYYNIDVFSENQKDSSIIENILKEYKVKYNITEINKKF